MFNEKEKVIFRIWVGFEILRIIRDLSNLEEVYGFRGFMFVWVSMVLNVGGSLCVRSKNFIFNFIMNDIILSI